MEHILLYLVNDLNMRFAWLHFYKCKSDHKFSYLIAMYSFAIMQDLKI